jgi:nucleoid-associated protein EbfC
MLGDMMEKLQQMKQNTDNAKERLNLVSVSGESAGGMIKVVCNGNRKIQAVSIDDSIRIGDSEELEDQLIIALNRALEQAENVNQSEMASIANGVLPPNLFGLMNK